MPANMKTQRGFTLIEMMIVTAIMSIIMLAIVTYVSALSSAVSAETIQGSLEAASNRCVHQLADDVGDGMIWSPAYPFDSYYLYLKRPADIDKDGTVLDSNKVIEMGVRAPWGEDDGWVCYFFDMKGTVSEPSLGVDINGDGDKNDTFGRGRLRRHFYSNTTHTSQWDHILANIVQVSTGTTWGGDINGDGVNDPLFSMNADGVLTISVWVYSIDGNGRPVLINSRTQVVPKNQWASAL